MARLHTIHLMSLEEGLMYFQIILSLCSENLNKKPKLYFGF